MLRASGHNPRGAGLQAHALALDDEPSAPGDYEAGELVIFLRNGLSLVGPSSRHIRMDKRLPEAR